MLTICSTVCCWSEAQDSRHFHQLFRNLWKTQIAVDQTRQDDVGCCGSCGSCGCCCGCCGLLCVVVCCCVLLCGVVWSCVELCGVVRSCVVLVVLVRTVQLRMCVYPYTRMRASNLWQNAWESDSRPPRHLNLNVRMDGGRKRASQPPKKTSPPP